MPVEKKTNLELIKSVRKEMPRPKQVIPSKKNQKKADKVGRKEKYKNGVQ